MEALVIIDMQYDFLEGGSLEVKGGNEIISIINQLQQDFELVISTQDWHPIHHKSFAKEHPGKNEFDVIELNGMQQVLWPVHCVQARHGAEFHDELDVRKIEAIFRKGMNSEIDSYSGFFDNGHLKNTGMAGYLKDRSVDSLTLVGLAADYCVNFSAKDALELGFKTKIIENATRAIDNQNWGKIKKELTAMGVQIV